MHNFLSSKIFNPKQHSKSSSLPTDLSGKFKVLPKTWSQSKSAAGSPTGARSAQASSLQLSKVWSSSTSSTDTAMSEEELDCFRSMRGTSINSTHSLSSAMSSDAHELSERLRAVRQAGEREKKVFDRGGQGYSILVTHEEVRVCHVDEKGEYHYRHLPLPAPRMPTTSSRSRRNSTSSNSAGSGASSRATSAERAAQKPKKQARRQVVQDRDGRTLVEITASNVTVFHDGGVWRCHRMLGKIWDSDHATHLTARMPRAWSRRPSDSKKSRRDEETCSALDADELARNGWGHADQATTDGSDGKVPVELLLCSNTPGEAGTAPRAYKSFYHNQ